MTNEEYNKIRDEELTYAEVQKVKGNTMEAVTDLDRVALKRVAPYQIGGNHYIKHTIQPFDIVREYKLDFFEGNALKYLLRDKGNRIEDLRKCRHYIEECIKNLEKK